VAQPPKKAVEEKLQPRAYFTVEIFMLF